MTESKTLERVKLLKKAGLKSYQNLGPLPDKAMYFHQTSGKSIFVTINRIDSNSWDCWHATWHGDFIYKDSQRTISTEDYRLFLDFMIEKGYEQVLELPWCRQRLYIKMVPQDGEVKDFRLAEQVIFHDHNDLPPWDVRLEDL